MDFYLMQFLILFLVRRMSVPEFLQRFSVIWLAHIGPDDWALEPALHSRSPWRAALAFRQWRAGFNAGGPHKCLGKSSVSSFSTIVRLIAMFWVYAQKRQRRTRNFASGCRAVIIPKRMS